MADLMHGLTSKSEHSAGGDRWPTAGPKNIFGDMGL